MWKAEEFVTHLADQGSPAVSAAQSRGAQGGDSGLGFLNKLC